MVVLFPVAVMDVGCATAVKVDCDKEAELEVP